MTNRYMEERVLSADPIELVHIVYIHAIDMVKDARRHLAAKDIAARANSIRKATDAINELDGSLNRADGGPIGQKLAGLYQYMRTRLITANCQQQDAPLAEVETLLTTLAEGWAGLRNKPQPLTEAAAPAGNEWGSAWMQEPQAELASHSWNV